MGYRCAECQVVNLVDMWKTRNSSDDKVSMPQEFTAPCGRLITPGRYDSSGGWPKLIDLCFKATEADPDCIVGLSHLNSINLLEMAKNAREHGWK